MVLAYPQDDTIRRPQPVNPSETGDAYLQGGPKWGGTGGGQQAAEYYAWTKFAELYGRNPTRAELDQVASAYISGDRNIANVAGGNAYIAEQYNQSKNTPEKQYARQQEEYRKGAGQHYGKIDELFQQGIGRTASQEEKDHFGALLASGQVDPYTIGQYLQQLPENVRRQDEDFRKQLSGELQGQDVQYLQEQVLPGIQSQFAQQGRDIRSSGFQNALAQAATQQNRQRESFLSNLSAQQYGGRQGAAREDYLSTLGRQYGLQDYSRQRSDTLADASRNRLYDIQNFAMQKQAYDDYLRKYGKRSSGLGQGIGSLAGMGLGALLAAPTGGLSVPAGAMLGGAAGGSAGSLFG